MALTPTQRLAVLKEVRHIVQTLGLRLAGDSTLSTEFQASYLVGDGSSQFPAPESGKIAVMLVFDEAAIETLDERGMAMPPDDGAPVS